MTTGEKIKSRRTELRLTLTELGEKVGVGASTIRKWETGYIQNMGSDKITKLSKALDVPESYLMGWSVNNVKADTIDCSNGVVGNINAPVTINGKAPSKEEEELFRIYGKLSVARRIKLLTFAMSLEEEEAI
jgi:repressor LexA